MAQAAEADPMEGYAYQGRDLELASLLNGEPVQSETRGRRVANQEGCCFFVPAGVFSKANGLIPR